MNVTGYGMGGNAQNQAMFFIMLKDWDQRKSKDLSAQALSMRIIMHFIGLRNASVLAFVPPPIIELGTATGFDAELVDFGNLGHKQLNGRTRSTACHGRQGPTTGSRPSQRTGRSASVPRRRGLG